MSRVKRGVTARKRHKKILHQAKGYYGARSKVFRTAKQAVIKANQYAYRDRKCKKRLMRQGWIIKINSAVRQYGLSYSDFISKIKKFNININRKMLSELIMHDFNSFQLFMEKLITKTNLS